MRESKEHPIAGFTYTIQQLGAKQGRIVLARVLRVVAGAAEASDPVGKLASALTDVEVDFLCDTFAKTTQVSSEDKPGNLVRLSDVFDDHFAGRYGAMIKWLWAALETNYGSFLSDVGLAPETLAATAAAAIKSGMTSTPLSPTAPSGGLSSQA